MRRRVLIATGASAFTAFALAGCLDGTGGDPTDGTDAPTETLPGSTEPPASTNSKATATDGTSTTGDPKTTRVGSSYASNEPNPDHEVIVENDDDVTTTIRVTVTRVETETVVYDERHELQPGASRSVYNLKEANPDGIEPFEVRARSDGATDAETIETSSCYGNVIVSRDADGELTVIYAVC